MVQRLATPTFRSIRPEDRTTVVGMMHALYKSLGAPDGYMNDTKANATLYQLEAQPAHLGLEVFEIQGALVGYALFFKFRYNEFGGTVLNIDELFVLESYRSKSIATQYLSFLENRENRDYVALTLEVLPQNHRAHALYKGRSFNEKETLTLYKML